MFDDTEYGRWLETARDGVRLARHDAAGGFHHAAVFAAEQAAQCALKALLHGVGAGRGARGHGLLSLLEAGSRHAGLTVTGEQREALGDLAAQYQATRYPDALLEGTPQDHYGPARASAAIRTAEALLGTVEVAWAKLQAAADAGDDDAG